MCVCRRCRTLFFFLTLSASCSTSSRPFCKAASRGRASHQQVGTHCNAAPSLSARVDEGRTERGGDAWFYFPHAKGRGVKIGQLEEATAGRRTTWASPVEQQT